MESYFPPEEERRSQPLRDVDQRNTRHADLSGIGEIKDCYREAKAEEALWNGLSN